MPWCGTMSFDTAGRTMMGFTSADLARWSKRWTPALAYGANCGVGASDLLRTVLGFRAAGSERPVIAKGNAGIPKYVDGHIHYDGTPELMARYAVLARDAGARIIGGCCGTQPEHLRKMRAALEETPRGDAPALEVIAAELGGFSSGSDGPGDDARPHARTPGTPPRPGPDDAALRLDTALGARMGKCPGVVIRNEAGLSALLDGLPFAEAPGSLVGILFLDRAATAADISEPRNRTTEEIAVHAGHIVVHYPDGMGRSHLGLDVTATGTMRNRNTVAAVAEMLRCLSRVSGVSDTAP
jgi:hypothetical protein